MVKILGRAALVGVCAALVRGTEVCDGDASCAALAGAEDETSLLMLGKMREKRSGKPIEAPAPGGLGPGDSGKPIVKPPSIVQCPGSDQMCSGNQCCPGIEKCGRKTFPCPLADRDFDGCQMGQEGTVKALLAALTREEKYTFLRGVGWVNGTWETEDGEYIGNIAHLDYKYGIPPLNIQDAGQGFRTTQEAIIKQVTSWPVALAVTASWDEEGTRQWAKAMGKEFRAKGANVILGPGVNFNRNALGGRNVEYSIGESAYLGARLVVPYVEGVQSERVLAVVKHFVNNQQEKNRDTVDAIVDPRTEWEVYYPAFEAAAKAGVAAVMCAYNRVNGKPSCGSEETLNRDFRGRMGFKGWVQSDWWAVRSFDAMENAVDQEMPGDATPSQDFYSTDENLATLSDDRIDSMVEPQLTMMLKNGLFEPKDQVCQPLDCNESMYETVATTPEHQQMSKDMARKALLLLKNDDKVLPLQKDVKKIALLNAEACDAAQDVEAQMTHWDLGSYYNIGGSGRVIADDPVSIYAGVMEKCKEYGCEAVLYHGNDTGPAYDFAIGADVVIICGGAMSTEGHDRESLYLDQNTFMQKVGNALYGEVPVISMTMSPGVILMPWEEKVNAAMNIFLAGKYTGTAFADALFGDINPSAKLPVTFPMNVKQQIPICDELPCPYEEGLWVGYQGMTEEKVRFPFGHGLSYTTFEYKMHDLVTRGCGRKFKQGRNMPEGCDGAYVCVVATVTNKGPMAGAEVAQLYMDYPEDAGEPPMGLRGFVRTEELEQGQSQTVTFPIYERDVQIWDTSADGWASPDGAFKVMVGSSSRDVRLDSKFQMCNGRSSRKLRTCRKAHH